MGRLMVSNTREGGSLPAIVRFAQLKLSDLQGPGELHGWVPPASYTHCL